MRNRRRYPKDWREIARACKERAGWKCERCGIAHRSQRVSGWTGNRYTVYLQAAHRHHDPENPTPELVCVCVYCHWHYYRKPGIRPAWVIERLKHRQLIEQILQVRPAPWKGARA